MTWLAAWAAIRKFFAALPWQVYVAGAVLAAGVLIYFEGKSEGKAECAVTIEDKNARISALEVANATNLDTIKALEAANRELAEGRATDKAKADAAIKALASERDALAADLAKRRANRETIYRENQDAAAWGRTRVPDRIADGLRQ